MASGMVVACRIARRRIVCRRVRRSITCRHVPARVGDLMSLPRSRLGEPNARRLPCPGPTAPVADAAPAVYEHVFFFMAVAFNDGSVGGAAKANRWAALIP